MRKPKKNVKPTLVTKSRYPDYLHEMSQKLSDRYNYLSLIATGRTGATYKIQNAINDHYYCLKTISPEVSDLDIRKRTKETLKKEVEILKPLKHRCLPRIYEFDTNAQLPYYVSSYHPGSTFEAFAKSQQHLTTEQSSVVITSLIDVLKYLHAEGRTHCDLHARNVMISNNVLQHGVTVIDFGSGHRESDTAKHTPNRGQPLFKELTELSEYGTKVDRESHYHNFQKADFRALGVLLAQMRQCFFHKASSTQLMSYNAFCDALINNKVKNWDDAQDRFLYVLDPQRGLTEASSLFVSRAGTPQFITLPIVKAVPVGFAPLNVINTKLFQRMRSIKQLSFCEWFYPGGTHTRFEHSLGAMGTAKRAVEYLVHDDLFRSTFSSQEIKAFLLASLVHDIGHYPFAHVLEQYVASRFSQTATDCRVLVSHSQHTVHLLNSDDELRRVIIADWGQDVLDCAIRLLAKSDDRGLHDLLDGPIDIDKQDYLARDAHHCGIPFGAGFNCETLLGALKYTSQNGKLVLGIREHGISAAEGMIILQDQMLSSVYWHTVVRAVISMFHAAIAHIVGENKERLEDLTKTLKACRSDHDAINIIVERVSKKNAHLHQLVKMHIDPSFSDIYHPVATYNVNEVIPPMSTVGMSIHRAIVQESDAKNTTIPINFTVVRNLRLAFMAEMKFRNQEISDVDLLIDVPYGKNAHRQLDVIDESGKCERLSALSHLNESIFTKPTAFLSPVRVYLSPVVANRIESFLPSVIQGATQRFHAGNYDTKQVRVDPKS